MQIPRPVAFWSGLQPSSTQTDLIAVYGAWDSQARTGSVLLQTRGLQDLVWVAAS